MSVSLKQSLRHFVTQEQIELRTVLGAVQVDVAALRASIVAFTAKLDADITAGGASETNYAATVDPAALTFTQ